MYVYMNNFEFDMVAGPTPSSSELVENFDCHLY